MTNQTTKLNEQYNRIDKKEEQREKNTSTIIDIVDTIGDAYEWLDKNTGIIDAIEDYIELVYHGVKGYLNAEAKNAETLQESINKFATPFKTPEQLEKLHLKQLVTTWEAIRNGEFSYLLNENSGGGQNSSNAYTGQYSGTNQEIVWQFMTNAGFTKEATAGMMGNIEWESGFKTDKIEAGTEIGFGLIQWSYTRREAIEARASKEGKDIHDIHFQLEFLLEELESGQYWSFPSGVYSFNLNMSYEQFKASNNVDAATDGFCWCFERPRESTANIKGRKEAAHKYYNEFKDATFSTGSWNGTATGLAAAIMNECKKYDGLSYTQNTNPSAGPTRFGPTHYDCSSLVEKIYRDVAGVELGSTTYQQVPKHSDASFGIKVPVNQAQPGDLLYYFNGGASYHVAISTGHPGIFHAANEGLGILFQKSSSLVPSYAFRISALIQNANNNNNKNSSSNNPSRTATITRQGNAQS